MGEEYVKVLPCNYCGVMTCEYCGDMVCQHKDYTCCDCEELIKEGIIKP